MKKQDPLWLKVLWTLPALVGIAYVASCKIEQPAFTYYDPMIFLGGILMASPTINYWWKYTK